MNTKGNFSMMWIIIMGMGLFFMMFIMLPLMSDSIIDESINETEEQNETISIASNLSDSWGGAMDIMQIVIIITVLAGAIAALVLFTGTSSSDWREEDTDEEIEDPFEEEDFFADEALDEIESKETEPTEKRKKKGNMYEY